MCEMPPDLEAVRLAPLPMKRQEPQPDPLVGEPSAPEIAPAPSCTGLAACARDTCHSPQLLTTCLNRYLQFHFGHDECQVLAPFPPMLRHFKAIFTGLTW